MFADQEIPQSPIDVNVASNHNAAKVRADGPGLEKDGVVADKPAYFTIHTRGAGKAEPEVKLLKGRGRHKSPVCEPEIIDNGVRYLKINTESFF